MLSNNIPAQIPDDVRELAELCADIEAEVHSSTSWGSFSGSYAVFAREPGQSDILYTLEDPREAVPQDEKGAYSAVGMVQELASRAVRPEPIGNYLGAAVVVEGANLAVGEDHPVQEPGETREQFGERLRQMTADGRLRPLRTLAATLASGWRVEVQRTRSSDGVDQADVMLFAPGEPPRHELTEAVDAWHDAIAW